MANNKTIICTDKYAIVVDGDITSFANNIKDALNGAEEILDEDESYDKATIYKAVYIVKKEHTVSHKTYGVE